MIVGLIEEPTPERVISAAPVRVRRRYLEHRLARAAAQRPARVMAIFDIPPLADSAQIDGDRQPFAAQRAEFGELAASVFDPAPVMTHEGVHFRRARAARDDELERMRRQQPQGQVARSAALANAERHPCEIGGTEVATRFEKAELLRHSAYRTLVRH